MPSDDAMMPFLLMGAFTGLVDRVHERLADEGFPGTTAQQGFALQAIGAGCTAVALGERLGVSKQAAAKTAATLERVGLVARRLNETDRRERTLTLTPRGRELIGRSGSLFRDEVAAWRARVGDEAVDATLRTLAAVGSAAHRPTDFTDWG